MKGLAELVCEERLDLEQCSATVLYTGFGGGGYGGSSFGGAGSYADFAGNSWGRNFKADLYIKETPFGQMHVHCTKEGLITGANLNGEPINNYQAAMLDLFQGFSLFKGGFGKW